MTNDNTEGNPGAKSRRGRRRPCTHPPPDTGAQNSWISEDPASALVLHDGVSRKDFMNKIGTCRKEARETKFFLRMVATAEEGLKDDARILWQEAKEPHLIFSAIWRR